MRKVLTALAGGALVITLSAPAAHAASAPRLAHHHCHHGVIGAVLDWLL
jgi:hypothetical protein